MSMNHRLSGDASLNAPIRASEGESGEWQDWLVDDHDSAETMLIEQDELENRRGMLSGAHEVLNERERRIFEARRLADEPMTLEELSGEFDISRERVRQIEVRAFEKVQDAVKAAAKRQARLCGRSKRNPPRKPQGISKQNRSRQRARFFDYPVFLYCSSLFVPSPPPAFPPGASMRCASPPSAPVSAASFLSALSGRRRGSSSA